MKSAFVDSNILVYRVEFNAGAKRDRAIELIDQLGEGLVISTQVLQEFYVVATSKAKVAPSLARLVVETLSQRRVVTVSPAIITSAIDTSERYRISFWDALIVEAANFANCSVLYTEDLNHGQRVRGVLIQNPFLDGR